MSLRVFRGDRMTAILAVILFAIPTQEYATAATVKKSLRFDDLLKLNSESLDVAVEISRDGKWIALERSGELVVVDRKRGRETANLGEGIVPIWAPNGAALAFYSTRSGERQLWVWNVMDGALRQITKLEFGIDPDPTTRISGYIDEAFRFSWSPDSRYIVFPTRISQPTQVDSTASIKSMADQRNKGEVPIVLTASTPYSLTTAGLGVSAFLQGTLEVKTAKSLSHRNARPGEALYSQLLLVDIKTSRIAQLTDSKRSAFHPAWSPDGRWIAFASIEGSLLYTQVASGKIILIDPSNETERILVENKNINYDPSWSSDGTRIAYLSMGNLFGRPEIRVFRASDRREIAVAPHFDRYVSQYKWDGTSERFIVLYKDGVSTRLGILNPESSEVSTLTLGNRLPVRVDWFAQSSVGKLVWRQFDPQALETIRSVDSSGSASQILMRMRKGGAGAADYDLGDVEIVRWRNHRGDQREGSILFPADYRHGRRYPLIVDVYPQRDGANWLSPLGGNYALGSLGYVVFRPSPRGPHVWMNPWKDLASNQAAIGPQGWDLAYDDVMSGVDMLIDRGIVDQERMGLLGHSNGGGVVTHLIGQTDRFRCAVIVAPAMTNWVRIPLLNLESDDAMQRFAGGKSLEQALNEYVALSPVFRLGKVTTPVLLAAGDDDTSFLINAVEIYNRLRANKKDVTFLRYPHQGHVFAGEALQDFWAREAGFFNKHLRPYGLSFGHPLN